MKLENKEKLKAYTSNMTKFIKKNPEYVLKKVSETAMWCAFSNRIFMTKLDALANAISTISNNCDEYREKVAKLYGKKKPWPRKRARRFHKMRVRA